VAKIHVALDCLLRRRGDVGFILVAAMFFTIGYSAYHWQFG